MQALKDEHATLDYSLDYSTWLDGDTITSSAWLLPAGETSLVVATSTFTTTSATVWLSGGVLGKTYRVTNRIATAAGRIDDHTLLLLILNR